MSIACIVLLVAVGMTIAAQPVPGTPRMAAPIPRDENFPTVNVVRGTPLDWTAAICAPRVPFMGSPVDPVTVSGAVLLSPDKGLTLPGATFHAACIAKDHTASSDPLLLVAQYPSEDSMQHDLARNGFQWYCFAATGGRLFVAATRATERTTDFGWSVSPVLQPLATFGFNIYSNPGH